MLSQSQPPPEEAVRVECGQEPDRHRQRSAFIENSSDMEMKMANEDQVKGKAKDIGGKIKEETGDAIGNDKMKRDGQADQVKGKVQKAAGDAKDKLSD